MSNGSTDRSTIVLIHGLWMTALSWEHWVTRYEAAGHRVIARSWPGMEADIDRVPARSLRGRPPRARGHRRPLRSDHRRARRARRSSWATRSAARFTADPARPRPRRRRRRDRLRRRQGHLGSAALDAPIGLPGPEEPCQRPQSGRAHARRVPLRLHQHPHRGRVTRGLRALRGSRTGPRPLPGRPRQLQPARRDEGRLRERRPRPAAPDRRRRRPRRARPSSTARPRIGTRSRGRRPRSKNSPAARTGRSPSPAGRKSRTTRSSGR